MQYSSTLLHANGLPLLNLPSKHFPDYNSINYPIFVPNSNRFYRDSGKWSNLISKDFTENMNQQTLPPPPMLERQSKTNLYIKGLPENFNDESLESLVPDKSKIKSLKAALEDDFKCKGYGFIDFLSEEDAKVALLYIQTKNPGFNAKYAKENEKDKTNLYVTNIPKEWTSKDSDKLKTYFEKFGPIQSAFIMMEKSTNKTVGVGFVRFVYEIHACEALEKLQKGNDYLNDCSKPIEAKFADKHNPETRKRRNPGQQMDSLSSVRSLNSGNCLINTNSSLTNNLCGYLNSQPLLLRPNIITTTASQVPLLHSNPESGLFMDLSQLYNLPSQTNYLYQLQNQLLAMQACVELPGNAINPLIFTNSIPNSNFTHGSSNSVNSGIDHIAYSQINNYPQTVNLTNYSISVPYSKNSNIFFSQQSDS